MPLYALTGGTRVRALRDGPQRASCAECGAPMQAGPGRPYLALGAPSGQPALRGAPAARAPLDDPEGVASLLDSLRQAGAHEQAAALTDRLPAAGEFRLFLKEKGLADQFRFGGEVDGTPAAPWDWEDLDLWLSPVWPRRRNRRDDLNNPLAPTVQSDSSKPSSREASVEEIN